MDGVVCEVVGVVLVVVDVVKVEVGVDVVVVEGVVVGVVVVDGAMRKTTATATMTMIITTTTAVKTVEIDRLLELESFLMLTVWEKRELFTTFGDISNRFSG